MNFADYKRFLEWYMGDDEFRERFDRAPAAALREAALSPETSVEFLQAIAAGCRSYNFRPVVERFPTELAELRGFAAALEEANPFTVRCRNACGGNARFEEWRERRRRANRAVLQPLYFDRSFNIAVAYELGVGCSGQCGFCCFDAPPLQENFRYTPENRELWRGVLALFCELLGDRAGAAALYWATDPFDNPDLEKFYRDFYELNQVWPPITTHWPLRDPPFCRGGARTRPARLPLFDDGARGVAALFPGVFGGGGDGLEPRAEQPGIAEPLFGQRPGAAGGAGDAGKVSGGHHQLLSLRLSGEFVSPEHPAGVALRAG